MLTEKSLFILLFSLLPFLGFSQSQRKINKVLKSEYAAQLNMYDSLMQTHDSMIPLYTSLVNKYKVSVTKRITQRRMIENKKRDVINIYRTLIQLDVAKSLPFTFQSLDSISLPIEINKLKSLGVSRSIPRQEWVLSLDKLAIKEQNEHLTTITDRLKQMNSMIAQTNLELVEFIPKLVAKQQELDEMGRAMNSTDVLLTDKLAYLFEQKLLARNAFSSKGPKGFNESYFVVFPEVFPPLNSEVVLEENVRDWEGESLNEPVNESPIVGIENPESNKQEVHTYYDDAADFPGGIDKLKEYIAANLKIPATVNELGIVGKCYLQFVVSTSGNISNVEVKRGVPDCPECDKEAVRVVKGMPNWIPAKIAGKAVNSTFNLPIKFAAQ